MSGDVIDIHRAAKDAHPSTAPSAAERARILTDQIKVTVEGAWQLIKQAYESRAWEALGYPTWDDYCTREFGTSRLRLPREERAEVVQSLRESGLSTRAIASATGIDRGTVRKDLQVGGNHPPAQVDVPDSQDPDPAADTSDSGGSEPLAHSSPESSPPPITGVDGKQYPASRPDPKPRRSALSVAALKAGLDLRKAVERVERVLADDRFPANKDQVTTQLRGHLTYAVQVMPDLLGTLTTEPQEAP